MYAYGKEVARWHTLTLALQKRTAVLKTKGCQRTLLLETPTRLASIILNIHLRRTRFCIPLREFRVWHKIIIVLSLTLFPLPRAPGFDTGFDSIRNLSCHRPQQRTRSTRTRCCRRWEFDDWSASGRRRRFRVMVKWQATGGIPTLAEFLIIVPHPSARTHPTNRLPRP
jgi:hypothetical protein